VVCSFVFLLLGLAALSSSINLLVLRFMILSLEEEEQVRRTTKTLNKSRGHS
jgi:SNF family Na+-dependent transporter